MILTRELLDEILLAANVERTPNYRIDHVPFAEANGLVIEFYRIRDSHLFAAALVERLGEEGTFLLRDAHFFLTRSGVLMGWPGLLFQEGR